MTKKILISLAVILVLSLGYWLISPLWTTVELQESIPVTTSVSSENSNINTPEAMLFERAPMQASAHEVSGEAFFLQSENTKFLRFENLKTINGPDLRIYLSRDLEATDFIDLGPIRATEGNVNYELPEGTDTTQYKNALIWCRAFGVLFSYAELR